MDSEPQYSMDVTRRALVFPPAGDFRPCDAANALWAVAHLRALDGGVDGAHDVRLVGRLVRYVACSTELASPLDVTSVLWALKNLGLNAGTPAASALGAPYERLRVGIEERCVALADAREFGHAATRSARHSLAELGWEGEDAFGTLPKSLAFRAAEKEAHRDRIEDEEFYDGNAAAYAAQESSLDRLLQALRSDDDM